MSDDDAQYQALHKQATDLNYKVHDMIGGDSSHPHAAALQREVRELMEDIEVRKMPRTIEDRVKTIQRQLKQAQVQQHSYLSYNEFDYLHDNYEHIRRGLQQWHNY